MRPSPHDEFKRIKGHYPALSSTGCTRSFCQSGRMTHTDEPKVGEDRSIENVEAEAIDFLHQLRRDGVIESDAALEKRLTCVLNEIRRDAVERVGQEGERIVVPQPWHQTAEELEHGIRLSWKHARKCIMRSEYGYLKLYDMRHITTSKEMGQAMVKGMSAAYNNGDIQPSVFVFPPRKPGRCGTMVWNQQFLAFAGYRQADGSILGDPMTATLTDSIIGLGWKPPAIRTRWDLLPIVTMADGDEPYITPVPESLFPLVQIRHPDAKHSLAFEKLGLRWVAAPALSRLGFDIGGVQYTGTPFIGWFMDAEIGVRDLGDSFRYNALPSVVSALGLLKPGQELDELPQPELLSLLSHAQAELNYACHWSYTEAGVRMSDSLTASAMYSNFDDQHLAKHGFRLPADPYWLAPPQGSIIPIWHRGHAPNYQPKPMICRIKDGPTTAWKKQKAERALANATANGIHGHVETNGVSRGGSNGVYTNGSNGIHTNGSEGLAHANGTNGTTGTNGSLEHSASSPKLHIFYCSSGVTAQRLATKLNKYLRRILASANSFSSIALPLPLNDVNLDALVPGDLVFIIASCAGRGDIPTNGQMIVQKCKSMASSRASQVTYCIFGNGNSSYGENFNGSATKINNALKQAGLVSDMDLFQADTLKEDPPWRQFDSWLSQVNAKYGQAGDANDGSQEDEAGDPSELLMAQLSPAEVLAVHGPSVGDMKRVALDVGDLEYSHMSHVDVFVPLSEAVVDDLLWTSRLSGDEVVSFEDKQVSTRQLFSLVDPDKPFTSLRWTAKLGITLSTEEEAKIAKTMLRDAIRELPIGWQAKAKRGGLSDFLLSLPTRRPRTFSTASSQLYWDIQNMSNVLELTVQKHLGGLFTDQYLSTSRKGDKLYIRIRHGPGQHLVKDSVPLIAFTTGSGIAPLRGLLQARSALAVDRIASNKVTKEEMQKLSFGNPVSLFLGFRPGDADIISESYREAKGLGMVDVLHLVPSNPRKERAQDSIFKEGISHAIRAKIRDQGAKVFVCASKEAADDFARNLEAVVGVNSIRESLGERWVEEVYVCTAG
ncbi:hypothetical protein CDD81_7103 [Ophiocordyceps australis]|uniref:nitric-oxide synthase (NADPH) n=1 Tax=Ophiocordyceps australis TaxID=1399860 RepID=A0A2C5Y449_9HYPO|nr:hypothetical protein CDD81_7103 [Ophiocordyceps australis]